MGKVSSSFLKELRPTYCGDASYSRDYPWCKKEPKAVDLTSYKESEKFWDILPYHTGEQVNFCRHFQSSILAERDKHCVGLTKDFRKQVKKVIAAMPDADAIIDKKTKSVIPTESQIHAMIVDSAKSEGSALSSSTIFDDPYIKKSRIVRKKLVEIAALKRAGDPAMESKISKLEKDISRVCIVNNPDALVRINADCNDVIKGHDEMKGWYQKGFTFVGGLFSTFVILVKTGALPKMWNAGKNQWKKARAGDPEKDITPDNFIWAGIKAIGAFFVARDPYGGVVIESGEAAEDGTVDENGGPLTDKELEDMLKDDPEPVSEGEITGANATNDAATRYSYGGSADNLLEYLGELTTTSSSLKSFKDALNKTGEQYRGIDKPPFDISTLTSILDALEKGSNKSTGDAPNSRFSTFIAQVNSEKTMKAIDALNEHHTDIFFDRLLPAIAAKFETIEGALDRGDNESFEKNLSEATELINDIKAVNRAYNLLGKNLHALIDDARKNTSFANPADSRRLGLLGQSLMYARGLGHDINNTLAVPLALTELIKSPESRAKFFRMIENYDISKLKYNIKNAVEIQSLFAHEMSVELHMSKEIPELSNIPKEMKTFIFRAVGELVLNAIKYADSNKDAKRVDIRAELHEDGLLDIIVEDNGVGIRNTKQVLVYGFREEPRMADGTGTGLSTIFDLANSVGVTLAIESSPGEGSKFSLKGIDTNSWGKSTPPDGSGSDGTPSTSGSTEAGGAKSTSENTSFHSFLDEAETATLYEPASIEDSATSSLEQSFEIYTGQSFPINSLDFIMGAGVFATQPAGAGR